MEEWARRTALRGAGVVFVKEEPVGSAVAEPRRGAAREGQPRPRSVSPNSGHHP